METKTERKQARWCSDCRRRQVIEDEFTESVYEPGGEMGFRVTWLACGHHHETNPVRIGAAPGAPSVQGAWATIEALHAAESFR